MTKTDRNNTMTDQTIPVDKLRALLDGGGSATDKIQAIYDLLPTVLPDPLFGARATHPTYGEGIVASHVPDEGCDVRFMFQAEERGDGTSYRWVNPTNLTFHTPDHPTTLTTEEDYENAPQGTIVAGDHAVPWFKHYLGFWLACGVDEGETSAEMPLAARRVMRWGETL